jgi:uncharacterized membrane protein YesL
MALFTIDSPFMKFMDRFVDVLYLNLLWLLFSLPLATIGASTAAACSVCLQLVDDEEGPIFAAFWKAFRQNFRQGSVLGLLNALAVYILYLDRQLVAAADDAPLLLVVGGILTAAFFFAAFIHAWPQVARYHNKLPAILKNSLFISVRFPLKTLLILAVLALEYFLFGSAPLLKLAGLLIGPMIMIYSVCGIDKRIFQEIDRLRQNGGEA